MKYKLRYLWSLAFASILASGVLSQPWSWSSMNLLAWGKPSSTKVGTFPDVNKQKYEGLAKEQSTPCRESKTWSC